MEYFKINKDKFILDNGNKICFMVMEYLFIKMDRDMKVNLKKIKKMGKECIIISTEIYSKVNGRIIILMVMAFYKENNFMKETGIKICQKDKEL
jgi:hypothetical protein